MKRRSFLGVVVSVLMVPFGAFKKKTEIAVLSTSTISGKLVVSKTLNGLRMDTPVIPMTTRNYVYDAKQKKMIRG